MTVPVPSGHSVATVSTLQCVGRFGHAVVMRSAGQTVCVPLHVVGLSGQIVWAWRPPEQTVTVAGHTVMMLLGQKVSLTGHIVHRGHWVSAAPATLQTVHSCGHLVSTFGQSVLFLGQIVGVPCVGSSGQVVIVVASAQLVGAPGQVVSSEPQTVKSVSGQFVGAGGQ